MTQHSFSVFSAGENKTQNTQPDSNGGKYVGRQPKSVQKTKPEFKSRVQEKDTQDGKLLKIQEEGKNVRHVFLVVT